jgi:hypothetical protein
MGASFLRKNDDPKSHGIVETEDWPNQISHYLLEETWNKAGRNMKWAQRSWNQLFRSQHHPRALGLRTVSTGVRESWV